MTESATFVEVSLMDTQDDGSPLQSMRRLFWCSSPRSPYNLNWAHKEPIHVLGRQADIAKTEKSSAAARHPGRKIQEPECGPLHQ
jgi:hypothetical protein